MEYLDGDVPSCLIIMQYQKPEEPADQRTQKYVRILEQPASTFRFRYLSEIKALGILTGANSTAGTKTYPTIEISGVIGDVLITISCVTPDMPYKPHPMGVVNQTVVTRSGFDKKDFYELKLTLSSSPTRVPFKDIGLICPKVNEIEGVLKARKRGKINPYNTGYDHYEEFKKRDSKGKYKIVRLCFQVKTLRPRPLVLDPVVSDIIYDKKTYDLIIDHVSCNSAPTEGTTSITIVCSQIRKDNISVIFFEERDGTVVWEEAGNITNVYGNTAIICSIPQYGNPVGEGKVFIKLKRKSDGKCSNLINFTYTSFKTAWKSPSVSPNEREEAAQAICSICGRKIFSSSSPSTMRPKQETIPIYNPALDLQQIQPSLPETPVEPYECIDRTNLPVKLLPSSRNQQEIEGLEKPLPYKIASTYQDSTHPGPSQIDRIVPSVNPEITINNLENVGTNSYLIYGINDVSFENIPSGTSSSGSLSNIPVDKLCKMECSSK